MLSNLQNVENGTKSTLWFLELHIAKKTLKHTENNDF